jgi:hypothetical protein
MVTTTDFPAVPPQGNAAAQNPLWKGRDVLVMTLAIIVSFVAGVAALTGAVMVTSGGIQPDRMPVAYSVGIIAIQGLAMLVAVWAAGLLRRRYTWADIGLTRPSRGWIAASVGLFFALRAAVILVAALLAQLGITSMQPQAIAPEGFTWVGAIGMLVFAGVVVPVAEEIFFRGVLYRWLRDKWGVAVGAIVSGLVFGIAHLEPATAIPAAIMGVTLALVFEKSKSLWPSILIHILNNVTAIGLLYALLASGVQIPGVN